MVDFSAIAVGCVGLNRSGFKEHHNPAMYFNISLEGARASTGLCVDVSGGVMI